MQALTEAAGLHPVARMAQAATHPCSQRPQTVLHDLHQHPLRVKCLTFALQLVTFSSSSWYLKRLIGVNGYHK